MQVLVKLCTFLLLAVWFSGCTKDVSSQADQPAADLNTSLPSPGYNGPRLSYGDSVFYLNSQPGDYSILPVTKRLAPSYFISIPKGLSMDSATGRILVSQSETGLRYKVYQVSLAGDLLDSVKIVVSGIDYLDAIYEIAATPNRYDTAFPIYNARPDLQLPCGNVDIDNDDDLDDDDNSCVFDETDLNGDGNDDIPGVIQDKLLVDIKKGTIDLEASFNAGIFGSGNPANGLSRDFTFFYRLQDASSRSLNKITVRVMHFRKRSDIPQDLLDTLNLRKDLTNAINKTAAGRGGNVTEPGVLTMQSFQQEFSEFSAKPKRPPIIIIVSQ